MSSRHFRKMNKQNNLPPPPDDSDDDYQPLYTRTSGSSKFAELEVSSSHSESEKVSEKSEEEDITHDYSLYPGFTNNKKNNKKKGKGKGKAAVARGVDEVEQARREVNAILGSPPPAPPQPTVNQALEVLTVVPKHLNVANELRRIFGPEEAGRRPRLPPHRALLLKRVAVHPNKDTPMYDFYSNGLTMMKYKEVDNRKYFVFNHDDAYQKTHRLFLKKLAHARSIADIIMLDFDHTKQLLHVEALLEISDRLFRMEENGLANEILENVVTFLQYSAHPDFILSQNNVRLEYKFLENRPFHCAMLKYIYLLTNKACHRTALEIAKMMLLIDPHDPLAVISVIDILALRCREHEWLIETVKYFDRQREASLLFNIKYSISLANFHVAHKNNRDLAEADRLIREAILAFPHIFVKILECSHVSNPELVGHEIFKPDPPTPWRAGASEVFMIYAKMTFPRWNEPAVMKWLMRNATELCAEYKINAKIRETARDFAISRHSLYQVWPQEYLRHLSVFSSVSNLIIDTPLTAAVFQQPTCAFDPLFEKSVNRYEYSYKLDAPAPTFDSNGNPLISHVFRNEFYKLFGEGERAKRNNPYPTMTAHRAKDKPRNRNATRPNAMPNDPPLSTTMYFWPKATTGMSPEQAAATNYANWQGIYLQQNMNPCKVNYTGHCVPPFPPSIDWDFDDCDGEFDAYDYADDAENFLRDEKAMEAALASGGADYDMGQEIIDAMDALYFDQRLRSIFRPSNSNYN